MLTDALSVDSITDEESDETGYSFEDAGTSTVRQAVLEIVMEKVNGHLTDLEQGIISMWINGSSYEQIEQELNVNFKKVDNTVQKFKRIVKTKIDPLLITIFFQN